MWKRTINVSAVNYTVQKIYDDRIDAIDVCKQSAKIITLRLYCVSGFLRQSKKSIVHHPPATYVNIVRRYRRRLSPVILDRSHSLSLALNISLVRPNVLVFNLVRPKRRLSRRGGEFVYLTVKLRPTDNCVRSQVHPTTIRLTQDNQTKSKKPQCSTP